MIFCRKMCRRWVYEIVTLRCSSEKIRTLIGFGSKEAVESMRKYWQDVKGTDLAWNVSLERGGSIRGLM